MLHHTYMYSTCLPLTDTRTPYMLLHRNIHSTCSPPHTCIQPRLQHAYFLNALFSLYLLSPMYNTFYRFLPYPHRQPTCYLPHIYILHAPLSLTHTVHSTCYLPRAYILHAYSSPAHIHYILPPTCIHSTYSLLTHTHTVHLTCQPPA